MREKILDILKNARGYVSGEEMSRELGVSRAAVWKHIKKLRDEGYSIVSVTNKGYRLRSEPDNMSIEKIESMLKTKYIGRKILHFTNTDSTNNEIKRRCDMDEGTAVLAEMQLSGKGRLGRVWDSPRGTGVWISILLKPQIPLNEVSEITLVAGLAACRAIGEGARIKWPNDIVIGTKKVCGILTEMSAETDRVNYVVCGIGINVNNENFPAELSQKATSIYIETGIKQDREAIASSLLNEFEIVYESYLKGGFPAIAQEYSSMCVTLGKTVRVIKNGSEIIGKAESIADDGALIVEYRGERIKVSSGEVSVRGIYGYI